MSATNKVTLWLDPPSDHFERDQLFDVTRAASGDGALVPFVHVRNRLAGQGVAVHTADLLERNGANQGVNLYVSTGVTKRFRRLARRGDVILSAFIAIESPIVGRRMYSRLHEAARVFRRMFACNRGGEELRPFLKGPVTFEPIFYPYSFDGIDEDAWSCGDRAFLVMINQNKMVQGEQEFYTKRLRVIDFFGSKGEIDLYGFGWEGPPYRVRERAPIGRAITRYLWHGERTLRRLRPDPLLEAARSVWGGAVKSKLETLSRYRFSIVIENTPLDGWITEKLFDCLRAGCVPVYLGAPDVDRWVPRECFIDMRDFEGYPDLRSYLHSLPETRLRDYREAGRAFMASEQFRPFTKDSFADLFTQIVAEDSAGPAGRE